MNKFIKKKNNFLVPAAIIFFFAGALLGYAGWEEPSSALIRSAINESAADQEKLGGLGINYENTAPAGLYVVGGQNSGFVGIGVQNPTEKLDVAGNLFLDKGLIMPQGKTGVEGDILTMRTENKMDWLPDLVNMTVPRLDIFTQGRGCVQIFPTCPKDFDESQVITVDSSCGAVPPPGAPQYKLGGAFRICVKDL